MGVKPASGPSVEMSPEFGRRENWIEAPEHAMRLNGSPRRWRGGTNASAGGEPRSAVR